MSIVNNVLRRFLPMRWLMGRWRVKMDVPGMETYEFSLAKALRYISKEQAHYLVDKLLLYNAATRDAMRRYGVRRVCEWAKCLAPTDKELHRELDRFADRHPDGSIAAYDILLYSTTEEVTLMGHTFRGLEEIKAHVAMSIHERSSSPPEITATTPKQDDGLHVGQVYASYPCFDAEDYAYEDRDYQNYIVRNRPVTEDEMLRFYALPHAINYIRVSEELPQEMLPVVYYDGDSDHMLVAAEK